MTGEKGVEKEISTRSLQGKMGPEKTTNILLGGIEFAVLKSCERREKKGRRDNSCNFKEKGNISDQKKYKNFD